MIRLSPLAFAALLSPVALCSTALSAQAVPPGETLSLTQAQKEAVLAGNSEASVDAARAGLDSGGGGNRQIHGEISAMVGTNGARGIAGTAAIPLGDNAGAIVSFERSHYGNYR